VAIALQAFLAGPLHDGPGFRAATTEYCKPGPYVPALFPAGKRAEEQCRRLMGTFAFDAFINVSRAVRPWSRPLVASRSQ
jgi:hypothetical protein